MSSTNSPDPPGRPAWSLAARLTAWYAGTGFLLIGLATGFLYWVLATNLDREDDELLDDKVQILRALLQERSDDLRALRQEVEWEGTAGAHPRFYMRVRDAAGRLLLESPGMDSLLLADAFPPAGDVRPAGGRSFRVRAARVAVGPSDAAYALQVALDRTAEDDLLARYRAWLWLVLTVALAVCVLAGHQIARRGLRPVAEISATARHIRSTTLHERIALHGLPGELFALAATFNDMLDRLEESFRRLAQFSADIAHELRTPLNNLRGEAEVALGRDRPAEEYREVLGSCLEESVRLARLIDSLLFLARADSPQAQIARERVDVARELAAVGAAYEAAAAEAGVTLRVAAAGEVVADLDRTLLQRAVGNLVANALAHTPAGGSVTLSASRVNGSVRVEVADTGAGIPADHLAKVWDRFYRADAARSTDSGRVGLGLALVKSIVALHGGAATITSEVCRGTTVRLDFPAHPSPGGG